MKRTQRAALRVSPSWGDIFIAPWWGNSVKQASQARLGSFWLFLASRNIILLQAYPQRGWGKYQNLTWLLYHSLIACIKAVQSISLCHQPLLKNWSLGPHTLLIAACFPPVGSAKEKSLFAITQSCTKQQSTILQRDCLDDLFLLYVNKLNHFVCLLKKKTSIVHSLLPGVLTCKGSLCWWFFSCFYWGSVARATGLSWLLELNLLWSRSINLFI